MRVKISREEFSVLKKAIQHYEEAIDFECKEINGNYYIFAKEDSCVDLREACSDYLLFSGFDKDYNPNSKGVILERLIDKFFTG